MNANTLITALYEALRYADHPLITDVTLDDIAGVAQLVVTTEDQQGVTKVWLVDESGVRETDADWLE